MPSRRCGKPCKSFFSAAESVIRFLLQQEFFTVNLLIDKVKLDLNLYLNTADSKSSSVLFIGKFYSVQWKLIMWFGLSDSKIILPKKGIYCS